MKRAAAPTLVFALIVASTLLGIAGTDLVLPAVPSLPVAFSSTIERAQLVLAAYALGTLIGLLAFGELGARRDPRRLIIWSVGFFALISLIAAFSPSIEWLIALRFAQGALGAGPAVFAPGFLTGLYAPDRAAAAMGRLGSIESLAPALAPIIGAYFLTLGGWEVSFYILAGLGVVLTLVLAAVGGALPAQGEAIGRHRSYATILGSAKFLRYAASQALSLGGLLVFVFAAPAVIAGPLGLGVGSFVLMQVVGVASFIVTANLSSRLAGRFGTERVIVFGTSLLVAAFVAILGLALAGGTSFALVVGCWVFVNAGFGIRGPVGFHQAILAAEGDHSRGAALVVAGLLCTAALGTAIVAPFITLGLWPPALAGLIITGLGLAILLGLRRPLPSG